MSIHLQSMAWKFSLSNSKYKQKSNIKLVLIKLCDNASDEGYCWPSMGRIAKECELSKRSVVDQINKLKEIGLIEVKHRFKNNEQKSNGYQVNIELLSGGELFAPPSESHSLPQCTDCTQNHHLTIKEPSGTDTSHSDERIHVEDLDKEDFPNCIRAINRLEWLKSSAYKIFTGALTIGEWSECEDAMNSVDCFDFDYFDWWMKERSKSMRKTPSLPNMLTDMNGTTFEQFYNSTFMQEWD